MLCQENCNLIVWDFLVFSNEICIQGSNSIPPTIKLLTTKNVIMDGFFFLESDNGWFWLHVWN